MNKPVLVIMAAGMGSRFGGLKQIEPIDDKGHMIIDFSIYDAIKAGFKKIYFIIKKENEAVFREKIGDRVSPFVEVEYVYQDLNNLPEGYTVPTGRIKPWGTGHAVLSCLDKLEGPFAVINADDYYGKNAFSIIYNFLEKAVDDEKYNYAMVGYIIENTLTENGYVSRGVCTLDEEGYLADIQERVHIKKAGEGAEYSDDDGKTWIAIPKGSIVSMNMWGFTNSILGELKNRFEKFLSEKLEANPLKAEFYLPEAVGDILKEGKGRVKVLRTTDKWYGITYKEDKERVVKAIENLRNDGVYPEKLWGRDL
ncbi:MAG: nucleotidyltransferase [Clostridiaceae bacterium]|jgi:NDP-sugar pyrophosphorylase family protein|nr:nucleotidyltransferase [Clostridiaceae bacterium]